MICKICGANMPDGMRLCSVCGNNLFSETVVSDLDETIIAEPVNAYSYQSFAVPEQPAYYTPPAAPAGQASYIPSMQADPVPYLTTPASPPKKLNAKMLSIVGCVVAVVVAVVLAIVFIGGNGDGKEKDEDKKSSGSGVATAVREYTEDYFDDMEFSGYKSEYKVSADGAYYQIVTANVEEDGEKGYVVMGTVVYKNEVDEEEFFYEFYSEEEKEEFDERVEELVETAKESDEYYKEELAEYAYYDEEN